MTEKIKILIIVLLILCLLFLGSGITLAVLFFKERKGSDSYQNRINALYEKSYYETLDNMTDIERKLGKVSVLSGSALQQEYLYEIWRQCAVSVSNLSQMASEDENIEKVVKFLNQAGDYCYYLSRKAEKEDLSATETSTLSTFRSILASLNDSLFSVQTKMIDGDRINASSLSDLTAISSVVYGMSDIDYPELIYDGPFSDGLRDRTPVFLEGKLEKTTEQCRDFLASVFSDGTDFACIGEGNSSVPTYVFSFLESGKESVAQVSKIGGYLVDYNAFRTVTDPSFDEADCVRNGEEFLRKAGYDSMECVWRYNDQSTVYLNFAFVQEGVVCYPDLIKLKVSAETGKVIGAEAQNFLYNHKERTIVENNSEHTVPEGMENVKRRNCMIPTKWGAEWYCEEVSGDFRGETYYIYYEKESGEVVETFVVVDNLLV